MEVAGEAVETRARQFEEEMSAKAEAKANKGKSRFSLGKYAAAARPLSATVRALSTITQRVRRPRAFGPSPPALRPPAAGTRLSRGVPACYKLSRPRAHTRPLKC